MKKLLLASFAILGAAAANAAILTYEIGTPRNVPSAPLHHVATLTITDTGTNTVKLKLDAVWDNMVFGANSFLGALFIKTDVSLNNSFTNLSGNPVVGIQNAGNVTGLDWSKRVRFETANNSNRLISGESSEFSISATGLSTASFGELAMVHLQGLNVAGVQDTSLYYTNPVPEPGTMAALAIGAMGILRRRAARK